MIKCFIIAFLSFSVVTNKTHNSCLENDDMSLVCGRVGLVYKLFWSECERDYFYTLHRRQITRDNATYPDKCFNHTDVCNLRKVGQFAMCNCSEQCLKDEASHVCGWNSRLSKHELYFSRCRMNLERCKYRQPIKEVEMEKCAELLSCKQCNIFSTCKSANDGTVSCHCPKCIGEEEIEICDDRGEYYLNECMMKQKACKLNNSFYYTAHCEEPEELPDYDERLRKAKVVKEVILVEDLVFKYTMAICLVFGFVGFPMVYSFVWYDRHEESKAKKHEKPTIYVEGESNQKYGRTAYRYVLKFIISILFIVTDVFAAGANQSCDLKCPAYETCAVVSNKQECVCSRDCNADTKQCSNACKLQLEACNKGKNTYDERKCINLETTTMTTGQIVFIWVAIGVFILLFFGCVALQIWCYWRRGARDRAIIMM